MLYIIHVIDFCFFFINIPWTPDLKSTNIFNSRLCILHHHHRVLQQFLWIREAYTKPMKSSLQEKHNHLKCWHVCMKQFNALTPSSYPISITTTADIDISKSIVWNSAQQCKLNNISYHYANSLLIIIINDSFIISFKRKWYGEQICLWHVSYRLH
jgi:hypothetical protein